MKLPKAIEIGKDLLTELPQFSPDERRDAVKLLIEAGERIKVARRWKASPWDSLLPSETEE